MCSKFDKLPSDETPELNLEGNEWELPNDVGIWEQVQPEFVSRLESNGWDETSISYLSYAVGEAIVNAIAHGNLGLEMGRESMAEYIAAAVEASNKLENVNKKVRVTLDISNERAVIKIEDHGEAYEPPAEEDGQEPEIETHGKGIIIMRKACDEVNFSRNEGDTGNVVELVKENKSTQT